MSIIDPTENIYQGISSPLIKRLIENRMKELGISTDMTEYIMQDLNEIDDLRWFVNEEGTAACIAEIYGAYGLNTVDDELPNELAALAVINIHTKYAHFSLSIEGAITVYQQSYIIFKEQQQARATFRKLIEQKLNNSNKTLN